MTHSVGTYSVGTGEDEGRLFAAASIVVSASALLNRVTAPGTVAVDESDRITIEPGWPVIEVELTQDLALT